VASPIESLEPAQAPDAAATVVLMSREGCHLCDEARTVLDLLLGERTERGRGPAIVVRTVDIDGDDDLQERYGWTVPVLVAGGRELPLALDADAVREFLSAAFDSPPCPT
jgi:hypothetical protein